MKVKQKLYFIFISLTLVLGITIGGWVYYEAKNSIQEQTLNGLEATLNSRINFIEESINVRKEQAEIIAGTYINKQLKSNGENDSAVIEKIQEHIDYIINSINKNTQNENSQQQKSALKYIGIHDRDGIIIANTKKKLIGLKSQYENKNEVKRKKTHFLGFINDKLTGEDCFIIYSPIFNYSTNDYAGGVVLKLSNKSIQEACFDFSGLGKTGELILAQKRTNEIRQIIRSRHWKTLPQQLLTDKNRPIQLAFNGSEGKGITKDYRNKEVLTVWKPIESFGWAAVIKIDTDEAFASIIALRNRMIWVLLLLLLAVIILSNYVAKSMSNPILRLVEVFNKISKGEKTEVININRKDELGQLSISANESIKYLNEIILHANELGKGNYSNILKAKSEGDVLGNALKQMTANLKDFDEENKNTIWLQSAIVKLNESLQGEPTLNKLCEKTIDLLVSLVQSYAGVIYVYSDEELCLKYNAGFAVEKDLVPKIIATGKGLTGQAVINKQPLFITNVEQKHLKIDSVFVENAEPEIAIIPLIFRNKTEGVIELVSNKQFNKNQKKFLQSASEILAVAISSTKSRVKIQTLLEESQAQTEELSSQQEELQQQTNRLVASEEELRMQQEELMESNKELEAQSFLLEQKALELEKSSQYKSEFLANMSHELRTPLNSIMLLSKLLSDDNDCKLTPDQKEFATIIHQSGNNLLLLINDILDITKIESGKIEICIEPVEIQVLCQNLDATFAQLAKQKNINYSCMPKGKIPEIIQSDGLRIDQILKNIIANAFKFTEKGSVNVSVKELSANESFAIGLAPINMLQFDVVDTGIGIDKEHLELIFNAFQQVDGSIRRRFGGTGLGLSISRNLARLLGGDIVVKSELHIGSTFSIYLPIDSSNYISSENEKEARKLVSALEVDNNNNNNKKQHKRVLLIEDNLNQGFAIKHFLESKYITCIVVPNANAAFDILINETIDCVILDMELPDLSGEEVIEKIINDEKLKKTPIIIYTGKDISQNDENRLMMNVNAIVIKSVNSYQRLLDELKASFITNKNNNDGNIDIVMNKTFAGKNILVVDDDIRNVYSMTKLLEKQKAKVITAINGLEALQILNNESKIDLILMDMMMPEMDGYQAIVKIKENENWNKIPIIAVTAKAMLGDKEKCLKAGASDYVTKPVNSAQLLQLIRIWLFKK